MIIEKEVQKAIDAINDAQLSVVSRDNACGPVNHLTIVGGVRHVEYYPLTRTIHCNPVKDKFKLLVIRNASVDDAIRVAYKGK